MKYAVLLILLTSIFSGCAPRDNYLKNLAHEARLSPEAPLIHQSSENLNAPVQKAWDLVANIDLWPSWNQALRGVKANGVTFLGDNFAWDTGKRIYSSVMVFEPNKTLVLFSKTSSYRSILKWEFESTGPRSCKVTLSESRDGFYMNFASPEDHQKYLEDWVGSLKKAAE